MLLAVSTAFPHGVLFIIALLKEGKNKGRCVQQSTLGQLSPSAAAMDGRAVFVWEYQRQSQCQSSVALQPVSILGHCSSDHGCCYCAQ